MKCFVVMNLLKGDEYLKKKVINNMVPSICEDCQHVTCEENYVAWQGSPPLRY